MPFEGKKVESIDADDILGLLNNQVAEGRALDYKSSLPGGSDEDKREFLSDVSSFANAIGGHLIYGIEEQGGIPVKIPGVGPVDLDQEKQRLENLLRDGLAPRIPGVAFHGLPLPTGEQILIIHIRRSWTSPHMVTFKNLSRFFSRNSAGKFQLDVSQIREAFTFSESMTDRLNAFRQQRLSDLIAGKTPVPLPESALALLHLIPLSAFGPAAYPVFDGSALQAANIFALKPLSGSLNDCWPNFDGILAVSSPGRPTYTQVYRSGAVEVADAVLLSESAITPQWVRAGEPARPHSHRRWIRPDFLESGVVRATKAALQYHDRLGVPPPVLLTLSLLRVSGYRIYFEAPDELLEDQPTRCVDRDVLVFPEILLPEDLSADVTSALRPVFDIMWNAAGRSRLAKL